MLIKDCGRLNAIINEALETVIPDAFMYCVYVNLHYSFPFWKRIIIEIRISLCLLVFLY